MQASAGRKPMGDAAHASARTEHPRERAREWGWSAAPVVLVLALGGALYAKNPQFFLQDDILTQYLPASRDIARAIWSGDWPLLTPYSWFGAALAGEYQHAVFSPFEVALSALVWAAPLSIAQTAAALVWVHLAILSAGASRLARTLGCGNVEATVVALIASANGWMMNWGAVNWYPALTSFAWLPWAWLALAALARRSDVRPSRVLAAALLLALIVSAGWLFTCAMMLLVTAWIALTQLHASRSLRPLLLLCAAWVLALALASPALAMLLDYGKSTERATGAFSLNRGMMVPLEGLLGIALPSYHTYWNNFFDSGIRRSVELGGALVPCACWAAALSYRGRALVREQASLLALVLICTLLATSPAIEGLRCSFRWLPLLHLTLALLGMQAWSMTAAPAWLPAAVAAASTGLVWLRALGLALDATSVTSALGAS
ncbi:MAG TPA: hypothetical protein VI299_00630, partial [Polyangiales bacterium]